MEAQYGTSAGMPHAYASREDHHATTAHAMNTNRHAGISAEMNMRTAKSRFDISGSKEFKLQELAMLTISPIVRSIHHWWLQRAERHYLICADVEQQRAREAQMNVAYYQKRAALARSARN
jgi:heme exporter protein D